VRSGELAREAAKLAPDLIPAVSVAARAEAVAGSLRRASRMVEKAFAKEPHPELADAYLDIRPDENARERLERIKTLAHKAPGHSQDGVDTPVNGEAQQENADEIEENGRWRLPQLRRNNNCFHGGASYSKS
jgi:hypothetical protein